MSILVIICAVVFIAIMLVMKFFVAPAIVSTYGIVGVIAFIAVIYIVAQWMEKSEKPTPSPDPPPGPAPENLSKADIDSWIKKIGDDLGRPKDENIIDAEFTVINPREKKK